MPPENSAIHDVSDTALWVAHYRDLESEQPRPLFHDRFARLLVGERGRAIAESMKATARYTRWSVVIRTAVIDEYIQNLVREGVDTVVNLGAGLDTRPYRLTLPSSLRWIEIDFPHMIEYKSTRLAAESPGVHLERLALDLTDRVRRREVFARFGTESKQTLILTEGVIPYLTESQVAEVAEDLRAEQSFRFWIAEYFSPRVYRYFRTRERRVKMKNAPFRFFPEDWFGFFASHGWQPHEIRYLAEESRRLRRAQPMPWWSHLILPFIGAENRRQLGRQFGYVVFVPTP
jgi:methyltransferase (TIGR00027 family)